MFYQSILYKMLFKRFYLLLDQLRMRPLIYSTLVTIVHHCGSRRIEAENTFILALYTVYMLRGLLYFFLLANQITLPLMSLDYLFTFLSGHTLKYRVLFLLSFFVVLTYGLISRRLVYARPTTTRHWTFYYNFFVRNLLIYKLARKSTEEIHLLHKRKQAYFYAKILTLKAWSQFLPCRWIQRYSSVKSWLLIFYRLDFINKHTMMRHKLFRGFHVPLQLRVRLILVVKILEFGAMVVQFVFGKQAVVKIGLLE